LTILCGNAQAALYLCAIFAFCDWELAGQQQSEQIEKAAEAQH
jgi:hypothetical protein